MIYGSLPHREAFGHLLAHPVWNQAFEWLRTCPGTIESGTYQLREKDLFFIVQNPETKPREQCRYESHQKYLDIQYCIAGGEIIDCESIVRLQPDGGYLDERDLQFYQPAPAQSRLHLRPGDFAIFYPTDAHRPLVSDNTHPRVLKAVVKVHVGLVM